MRCASCPSPDVLKALCCGGLPEQELARLEEHVLECAGCLAVLQRLLPAEETQSGLERAEAGGDLPSGPVAARLAQSLKALWSASDGQAETQPSALRTEATVIHDLRSEGGGDLTGFLAPSQAPDEIGRLG